MYASKLDAAKQRGLCVQPTFNRRSTTLHSMSLPGKPHTYSSSHTFFIQPRIPALSTCSRKC